MRVTTTKTTSNQETLVTTIELSSEEEVRSVMDTLWFAINDPRTPQSIRMHIRALYADIDDETGIVSQFDPFK